MKNHIDFKKGKIYYSCQGAGRCIVLLHGFLEQKEMWEDYVSELSKRYKVITVDLPGHGKSDSFGYVHEMGFMAGVVNAVIKSLRIRKIFIAGHSMGGYVALAFAEKFPKKTKAICLLNSTVYSDSEERKNTRLRAINIVKENHKLYVSETISNLFTEDFRDRNKSSIERLKKLAQEMAPPSITASLEGMRRRNDFNSLLNKKNSFPVFFIIGAKDMTIPFESSLTQVKNLDDQHYKIIENSGHMSYLENPLETMKALKKFIGIAFLTPKKNI